MKMTGASQVVIYYYCYEHNGYFKKAHYKGEELNKIEKRVKEMIREGEFANWAVRMNLELSRREKQEQDCTYTSQL